MPQPIISKGGTKAPAHQENDPMSDQSTRASDPNPDPRQRFTLTKADAMALDDLAQQTLDPTLQDRLNAWWAEAGERLGFVWTTVADLELGGPREPEECGNLTTATFTAWPIVKAWEPDADAVAWLADMVVEGDADALKNRELILRAWAAGRDTGFAMGSATAQANRPGLGWDGMILIRESAELLRSYEAHHLAKVERLVASGARDPDTEAAVDDTRSKARRNAAQAERLESFLADPAQSIYCHDLLREVMEDNRTAALAGWHAAMLQVRELVESGQAQAGSGIPPLVLLSRLEELPPPEDMDEVFERLRTPMLQVERLRVALREWFDKSDWVREAINARVPQSLGMPSQLGRHTMDTARDLVKRMNDLLAEALADRLIGLRVQAAADVLQAMGIARKPYPNHEQPIDAPTDRFNDPAYRAPWPAMDERNTWKGTGAPSPSSRAVDLAGTHTRFPAAEGLECMGKPEGEA